MENETEKQWIERKARERGQKETDPTEQEPPPKKG